METEPRAELSRWEKNAAQRCTARYDDLVPLRKDIRVCGFWWFMKERTV